MNGLVSGNAMTELAKKEKQRAWLQQKAENFNEKLFDGQLPMGCVKCSWGRGMKGNAGKTKYHTKTGFCEVELNKGLLDTGDKIDNTLVHELCHVAVFLIDCDPNGGHGSVWKKWVDQVQKKAEANGVKISIEQYHHYRVSYPFTYICLSTYRKERNCKVIYGSQKSLSPTALGKYRCRLCHAELAQVVLKEEPPKGIPTAHIQRARRVAKGQTAPANDRAHPPYQPTADTKPSLPLGTQTCDKLYSWEPLLDIVRSNSLWIDLVSLLSILTNAHQTQAQISWFPIDWPNHSATDGLWQRFTQKLVAKCDIAADKSAFVLSVHSGWESRFLDFGIALTDVSNNLLVIFVDYFADITIIGDESH